MQYGKKYIVELDVRLKSTKHFWNVTGTVLASSGNDGSIRLWKGLERNSRCWNIFCLILYHGHIPRTFYTMNMQLLLPTNN